MLLMLVTRPNPLLTNSLALARPAVGTASPLALRVTRNAENRCLFLLPRSSGALSNSGESPERNKLLLHSAR
jgi:hypothetical protein